MTFQSGVRVSEQADNYIGTVRITGPCTAGALLGVLARAREWVTRTQLPAMVGDYTGAIILARPDVMRASVLQLSSGETDRWLLTPAAIVVVPWQLEMIEDYARLMRQHGLSRAAFTCPERARAWAAEQAALRAAQMAHRLLARISR